MAIIVVTMITEVVMMILLQGGGEGDWSLLLGLTQAVFNFHLTSNSVQF